MFAPLPGKGGGTPTGVSGPFQTGRTGQPRLKGDGAASPD